MAECCDSRFPKSTSVHQAGSSTLLFVKARKKQDGLTVPTFLGPVDYVSHKVERPLAFTWKLQRPMPADFFRAAKVASA